MSVQVFRIKAIGAAAAIASELMNSLQAGELRTHRNSTFEALNG